MNILNIKAQNFNVLILLLLLSSGVFAQKEAKKVKVEKWQPGYVIFKNSKDTVRGYIHLNTDYLGYIKTVWFNKTKEKKLRVKGVLKVVANGDDHMAEFNENYKDTIQYFGVNNKRYKYVTITDNAFPYNKLLQPNKVSYELSNRFVGWSEIIEEGSITISLAIVRIYGGGHGAIIAPGGAMIGGGGSNRVYVPMYLLEKKNKKRVLISSPHSNGFRDKKDFMNFEVDDNNKIHFADFISNDSSLTNIKNQTLLFKDIENYVKEYNTRTKQN